MCRLLYTVLFLSFLWQFAAAQCLTPSSCGATEGTPVGRKFYWVGGSGMNGSGDFNNGCHWRLDNPTSGIIPCQGPISSNTVIFPASSFTMAATITVSSDANCRSMIWESGISQPVTFRSVNDGINLDIYGDTLDFIPAPNLQFTFSGILRFRSTKNGIVDLHTQGQQFKLSQMLFQGSGNTTYRLMSSLFVDDTSPVGSVTNINNNVKGILRLISGGLNTNGMKVRTDFFQSLSGISNRQLILDGSRITCYGNSGGTAGETWSMDMGNTAGNYTLFSAVGSHVILDALPNPTVKTNSCTFGGGTGIVYDTVTLQAMGRSSSPRSILNNGAPHIRRLYLMGDTRIITTRPVVDTMIVQANKEYWFVPGTNPPPRLTVDAIVVRKNCATELAFFMSKTATCYFIKKTPGALITTDVILHNAYGDITNGSTYTANNSVRVGLATNWTINQPAGRRMRFHDYSNNQHWHTVTNWDVWDGAAWVRQAAGDCLPSPMDDVVFDAASFTNNAAGTVLNARRWVRIDSLAFARDYRWLDAAVNTNASMRLRQWDGTLNVFGTFQVSKDAMEDIMQSYTNTGTTAAFPSTSGRSTYTSIYSNNNFNQGVIELWGGYNTTTNSVERDSIITKGVKVFPHLRFNVMSYYHIVDSLDAYYVQGYNSSHLYTGKIRMTVSCLQLAGRHMDSTTVYIKGNGNSPYSFYDAGNFDTVSVARDYYTGTTSFIFAPDTLSSYLYTYQRTDTFSGYRFDYLVHLPNTIFRGDLESIVYDMLVHGDLRFEKNANIYGNASATTRIYVTGWMSIYGDNPYQGNVYLTAGKTYIFSSGYSNSRLLVNGSFFSPGLCDKQITIRTLNGNAIPVKIAGASTITYTSINGWNNTGNPVISASFSIDAGNNTNVSVTGDAAKTFYWRARQGSGGADFRGNWSDARHWTIFAANIEGDGGCLPTLKDTVIFDGGSGGATDTCYIDNDAAACGVFWYQGTANTNFSCVKAVFQTNVACGMLSVGHHWWIDKNATIAFQNFNGNILYVNNPNSAAVTNKEIRSSGTSLRPYWVEFKDPLSNWTLSDDFEVDKSIATSPNNWNYYGVLFLTAGTLNTNGYNLTIANQFVSLGTQSRTLNLGSSQVYVRCNGINFFGSGAANAYPWYITGTAAANSATMANLTINPGTSTIHFLNNTHAANYIKTFLMGSLSTIRYNDVKFYLTDENISLQGNSRYRNLWLNGNTQVDHSNTVDTLRMQGSYYYTFEDDSKQTLTSPNGTIIAYSSPGNFVNIESYPVGTGKKAKFHKDYGNYICLDYIKVRDNAASRATTGTVTPNLFFFAGANSDNIGNTATGIWSFSLGIANHSISTGDVYSCEETATGMVDMHVAVTGVDLDGYSVDYCHYDELGNGLGCTNVVLNDDDNNPATPFIFTIPVPAQHLHYYTFDIAVLRCGGRSASVKDTAYIRINNPEVLVAQDRHSECYLTNKGHWIDFFDEVDNRPVVSLLDSTSTTDNDSLEQVDAFVNFDPTITYCQGRPRLPRYWQITPTNNKAAKVRLYFTQAELDALGAAVGASALSPADLDLWKFEDGQLCGTYTDIPFTEIDINSSTNGIANNKSFSTTLNVYAIEFDVASFSHFVLVPDSIVLLSSKLLTFDAIANADQHQAELSWKITDHASVAHFEVERSKNGFTFERIQTIYPQNTTANTVHYQTIDPAPYSGTSYYRLRVYDLDGNSTVSPQRSVWFEGVAMVSVFPVPVPAGVDLQVQVQLPQAGALQFSVIDVLGRSLRQYHFETQGSGAIQTLSLPLAGLSAGTYYLQMKDSAGNTQYEPFVVQ